MPCGTGRSRRPSTSAKEGPTRCPGAVGKPGRIDITGGLRRLAGGIDGRCAAVPRRRPASSATVRRQALSNEEWKSAFLAPHGSDCRLTTMAQSRFQPALPFALFVRQPGDRKSGGFPVSDAALDHAAVVGSTGDGLLSAGPGLVDSCSLSGIARSGEGHEGASEGRADRRAWTVYRQYRGAANQSWPLRKIGLSGLRGRLESFHVVPQYKELEIEASRITGEIDNLNIENVVDHDLIRELEESLTTERAPDTQDLAKVYAEVGIVLPKIGAAGGLHRSSGSTVPSSRIGGRISVPRSRARKGGSPSGTSGRTGSTGGAHRSWVCSRREAHLNTTRDCARSSGEPKRTSKC